MGMRDIDGVSKLGVFFRASAEELVRAADYKSIFDGIDWRIHGRNEITGAMDENRCFIRILIGVITLRSEMRAWPSWLIVPGYGAGLSGVFSDRGANFIGAPGAGARNVISGNDKDGVEIFQGGSTKVAGNYIGVNAAGTAALGNSANGVLIFMSALNTIGGGIQGEGNVISANGRDGVNARLCDGTNV
jgi:hypothetical protein